MDVVEKTLRTVRILMIVQAGLGLAAGVFVLYLLGLADADADTDVSAVSTFRVLVSMSLVLAAGLLVCGVLLPRRHRAVLITSCVLEALTVLGSVANLVTSASSGTTQPTVAVPLLFAVLVLLRLARPEVRAAFAQPRPR